MGERYTTPLTQMAQSSAVTLHQMASEGTYIAALSVLIADGGGDDRPPDKDDDADSRFESDHAR